MEKLIIVSVIALVATSAEAGLSTGARDQGSVRESHAEVHQAQADAPVVKKRKPVTFDRQIESTFRRAFRF